jgi:hypothetical protein
MVTVDSERARQSPVPLAFSVKPFAAALSCNPQPSPANVNEEA